MQLHAEGKAMFLLLLLLLRRCRRRRRRRLRLLVWVCFVVGTALPSLRRTLAGAARPTSSFLSRLQLSSGMLTTVRNPVDVIANSKGVNVARVGSVKRKNPLFNIDREGTLGGETEADSSGRAVSKAGGSTTTKFVDGAAADSSTTDGAAADGETKGEQAKKKRKMFGWLKGKGSKVRAC